jgi:hypothetical protein
MYCLNCKEYTQTSVLKIVEKTGKKLTCFYLQGICSDCKNGKSNRLGKEIPTGYSIESTSEELKTLLTGHPNEVRKPRPKQTGTGLNDSPSNEELITAAVTTETADKDGEGLWENIKNIGHKKTFADRLGNTAANATKSLVRGIPVVGDLLADSGIVDKGIDLFSEYVWQPLKKWFGGSLDDAYIEELKKNDKALSELAEKLVDLRIKTGDGIIPRYLGELRNGSDEDKALSHVLMKTVCKPKFYRFLKDENIPSTMSILEAMTKYKSRDKAYKNDEEKALQILSSLGYSNV